MSYLAAPGQLAALRPIERLYFAGAERIIVAAEFVDRNILDSRYAVPRVRFLKVALS